jgi:MFS family permease
MSDETTAVNVTNRGSLLPILSVNFVGTLGFSIVVPFLVFLVTKWGGNALIFGLMGATYSAFQLIGAPILGRWSDRHGRRKILLLSQLGTLLSWAIFLIAFFLPVTVISNVDSRVLGQFTLTLPLIVLFIARAADGITGGNVSVANAYLADITDEDHRSENFGRMAISGNLGFILGPALAGILGATLFGEILPVVAALLISLVATLIIAFGLKEYSPCTLGSDPESQSVRKVFGQEQKECYRIEGSDQIPVREIFQLHYVPAILTVYFLVMLGFSFFYIAFPVHAARGLHWSVTSTGAFFAVLSLLMVVVQGPVLSQVSKKLSDPTLVIGGSLILSVGFVFLLGTSTMMIYAAAALIALGNGLMWPSVMAMLSRVAGERHQGVVQGVAGSVGAVASIIGLIMGGLLYNWFNTQVFVVAAATISAVAVISVAVRNR